MELTKASPLLTETGPMVSAQSEDNTDHTGIILSNDPSLINKAGVPFPTKCEFCGKELYRKGIIICGSIQWFGYEKCDCPAAKAAWAAAEATRAATEAATRKAEEIRKFNAKKERLIKDSGMGARFRSRTFDTFIQNDNNKVAFATCWNYAKGFDGCLPSPTQPAPNHNGLYIVGTPGAGKTHLAAAIANYLIDSKCQPVIFKTSIDLLEDIKNTYSPGAAPTSSVLTLYKSVPLLIIDDLGKEPTTEWGVSTLYNIINIRYEACLPIIVTTNYNNDALIRHMTPRDSQDSKTAECILDRLAEMCIAIKVIGPSARRT